MRRATPARYGVTLLNMCAHDADEARDTPSDMLLARAGGRVTFHLPLYHHCRLFAATIVFACHACRAISCYAVAAYAAAAAAAAVYAAYYYLLLRAWRRHFERRIADTFNAFRHLQYYY